MTPNRPARIPTEWIFAAGFAGGFAEVAWVSLMSADPAGVARQVTATLFGPASTAAPEALTLGLAIHFVLSLAIAAAFAPVALIVARRAGPVGVVAASVALLAAIWTCNFFVVLPAVNPAFVALMPLSVTLASKLLFGVAMGAILAARAAGQEAVRSLASA